MRRLNALDWIALVLLIIGGLNWGLVGFFTFDLVAWIFGGEAAIVSRIVYALVGLSAIYVAVVSPTFAHRAKEVRAPAGRTAPQH